MDHRDSQCRTLARAEAIEKRFVGLRCWLECTTAEESLTVGERFAAGIGVDLTTDHRIGTDGTWGFCFTRCLFFGSHGLLWLLENRWR